MDQLGPVGTAITGRLGIAGDQQHLDIAAGTGEPGLTVARLAPGGHVVLCNCGQLSLTYDGPDPERITLCQCYECQRRTGSTYSVQARLPVDHVTIEGQSTTWTFPESGKPPAEFRSCDSQGLTYHFCPKCGSTVYWDISGALDFVGVAVGNFTDPAFPPPVGAGFEAYGAAWALNVSELHMPLGHHDYDGTSYGGPRA